MGMKSLFSVFLICSPPPPFKAQKKIRFFEKIGFLAERLCKKIRFFEKIGFLAERLYQKKSDFLKKSDF
jgi:hypothetical protein